MADYQSLSDSDLFSLLSDNDHLAYIEIYNRYSGLLYIHAHKRTRNKGETSDLIQHLFTILWNRRIRFN